jgi:acetyltransferase-like isoleucine patch superfamily enzyme
MRRLLRGLLRRLLRLVEQPPASPHDTSATIKRLRARGVRIGEDCAIYTEFFSTEPYLVSIGSHVGISGGVKFLTHDGSAWLMRGEHPKRQVLGTIVVGDNTFIGENSMILCGTSIGSNCIVGAGAVVRGRIPDNSLVIGNPGQMVGRASLFIEMLRQGENSLDTLGMEESARRELLLRHFGLEPTGERS